ncbi:MAG: thermonuclease family protein [Elusimicrobiota bacterium]|nr:MAG: thermonuclease family protein [Elusimicrobiota bacterium]
MDAPETAKPEYGKPGQPYGDEAAGFVSRLVLDKTVTVYIKEADKFGRFVGWVTLADGRALQHELLREGWAWWNFFFNKDEALNRLENEAILARRGLWAGKTRGGEFSPEAPWVFRRRLAAGLRRILPGEELEFKFKRVSDGDTVALGTNQSVYDYIRLAGVDAPEVSRNRTKPGQPYGAEAGARAAELIAAEGATIQVKVEDVDPYGRLVGWIRLRNRGGSGSTRSLSRKAGPGGTSATIPILASSAASRPARARRSSAYGSIRRRCRRGTSAAISARTDRHCPARHDHHAAGSLTAVAATTPSPVQQIPQYGTNLQQKPAVASQW